MFYTGVILETRIYGELCSFTAVSFVLIAEQRARRLVSEPVQSPVALPAAAQVFPMGASTASVAHTFTDLQVVPAAQAVQMVHTAYTVARVAPVEMPPSTSSVWPVM